MGQVMSSHSSPTAEQYTFASSLQVSASASFCTGCEWLDLTGGERWGLPKSERDIQLQKKHSKLLKFSKCFATIFQSRSPVSLSHNFDVAGNTRTTTLPVLVSFEQCTKCTSK